MRKKALIVLSIIAIIIVSLVLLILFNPKKKVKRKSFDIYKYYNEFVKAGSDVKIYNKDGEKIGVVSNTELKLEKEKTKGKHFYAKDIDAYISYKDVSKIDGFSEENLTYKNYIPFNIEVLSSDSPTIYVNESSYFKFNSKNVKFEPIMIDGDKYYFVYNDKLSYILESDIKEKNTISKYEMTDGVSVINYHYVVNEEETKECRQSICLLESKYDEQMKYLKDNEWYTASMKDLDLWIDKKINLPLKTVVITIDDGWYLPRNMAILEKYGLHATLFLIGSLASPTDYNSSSIEIHSHTWNMHNLGECPIKRGGAILCKDMTYILDDLKKSRDSLNGSEYFAYPFYEYNDHAIEALKEAGFRMAFAGGNRKVKQGVDKFVVPRFGITNTGTMNEFINYIN